MKVFKVFFLGMIYGWFVKFAFDRIYRDNEFQDIRNENAFLQEYIRSLEERLQRKSPETESVASITAQPKPLPAKTGKDNLKVIKGIGPAIEKKLNNAGIHTFDALARLSVEELESILGNTKRLVQNEADIIAQAADLAAQQ